MQPHRQSLSLQTVAAKFPLIAAKYSWIQFLVTNTTCGASTGGAVVIMQPGVDYNFVWTNPFTGAVFSTDSILANVAFGTYKVQVSCPNDPSIQDNFTIVVSNTDGPMPTSIMVQPATCLLNNGSATLLPTNFVYTWDDLATPTNTRTNLVGRTYTVKVVDPVNPGPCFFNWVSVTIPQANPMTTQVTVLPAKCGLPTGSASAIVAGGSGNYTYDWAGSLSTGSNAQFLIAGVDSLIVNDATWGCQNKVIFTVADAPVTGSANIVVTNAKCPAAGSIEVNVTNTSANFALPAIIQVFDFAGDQYNPIALPANIYQVRTLDHDSCLVDMDTVVIENIGGLTLTYDVMALVCAPNGGTITVNASNGINPYLFTWSDLPGQPQSATRIDIPVGVYSVTASDAQGCTGVITGVNMTSDPNCNGGGGCNVSAGTIGAVNNPVCFDTINHSAIISGFTANIVAMPGFDTLYLLANNQGLIIQSNSGSPTFTVGAVGSYSIHTVVYHIDSLNVFAQFSPGLTTLTQFTAAIQGSCTGFTAAGAQFVVNTCGTGSPCVISAGAITPAVSPVCLTNNSVQLTAVTSGMVMMPGYDTLYLLANSQGVITSLGQNPTFAVGAIGNYSIHTVLYHVDSLNAFAQVSPGLTTLTQFAAAIQGSCTRFTAAGAQFVVNTCGTGSPCVISAGAITPAVSPVCLANNSAQLTAVTSGMVMMPGYDTLYLLANSQGVITSLGQNPTFAVGAIGNYSIHTVLYHVDSLNAFAIVNPGLTTLTQFAAAIQGSCTGFTAAGAQFVVNTCGTGSPCVISAGAITPAVSPVCLTNNSAQLTAVTNGMVMMPGYDTLYLLANSQGVITSLGQNPTFAVGAIGNYSIHTVLYHVDSLNAFAQVSPGLTTLTQFASAIQGSCTGFTVAGAQFVVNTCSVTPACTPPAFTVTAQLTNCMAATGSAQITLGSGAASDYVITWKDVFGTTLATNQLNLTNLPAGAYQVTVANKDTLTCKTEHVFAIQTQGGVVAQIDSIAPANCFGANGYVRLKPSSTNYVYAWSNTESGFENFGLNSGLYAVTVTDTTNTTLCPNVLAVVVPNVNPLNSSFSVVTQPYCGGNNGVVNLTTSGGSGTYAFIPYGFGSPLQVSNLAAGAYTVRVIDNVTSCDDTIMFTLTNVQPTATIAINQVIPASCAGVQNGQVIYSVAYGPTFTTSPVVQIKDAQGNLVLDNNLVEGSYCIFVSDANGCQVANECFTVPAPVGIQSTIAVTGATCTVQGSAVVNISNGSGSFTYNWADIAGNSNPANRFDLVPGTYTLTITDNITGCSAVQNAVIVDDCVPTTGCSVTAGTIAPVHAEVCLTNGVATIAVTTQGANLPIGYQAVYLLAQNGVVQTILSQPNTMVNNLGTYTVHALYYSLDSLPIAPGIIFPGTTTIASLNAQLVQGGGTLCAALTVNGAQITVKDCSVAACPTPVTINSVAIANSTCGQSTGGIALVMPTLPSNYTYAWTPNVSANQVATNLSAGVYSVSITLGSNTACTLDTSFVVSNTDGPQFNVGSVTPANCLAANGAVTLTPSTYTYVWSNTESGAVNTDLIAGCYQVTATNASGCTNAIEVCVPDAGENLDLTYAIVREAKCGRGLGEVQMTVTGGSGAYSYSLGNTSLLTGLYGGPHVSVVRDNLTGCADSVSFVIQDLQVTGTVDVTVNNPNCAGQGNGFLTVDVLPGTNFALPYNISVKDTMGVAQGLGNLTPGIYIVVVTDADLCPLSPDTVVVIAPTDIVITTQVTNATCQTGGGIQVSATGGTGGLIFDWQDLQGTVNPKDRTGLGAGLYTLIVYDSLFCSDTTLNLLVVDDCQHIDTLELILPINTTDSLCVPLPAGSSTATWTLINAANSSSFGSWTLSQAGCLVYQSGSQSGLGIDTICVQSVTSFGTDTTCIVVSITAQPVISDTVYFVVQANGSATACGAPTVGINNPVVSLLNGIGLSGTSPGYGTYTINDTSGCITFNALSQIGFVVDTICVSICDPVTNICHITCYVPSIVQTTNCDTIFTQDTIFAITTNCAAGANVCIDLPYQEIVNYTILDNFSAYTNGYLGCEIDTLIAYAVFSLPGQGSAQFGPYTLEEWTI